MISNWHFNKSINIYNCSVFQLKLKYNSYLHCTENRNVQNLFLTCPI